MTPSMVGFQSEAIGILLPSKDSLCNSELLIILAKVLIGFEKRGLSLSTDEESK